MVNKNYVFPRRERIDFIISYIVLFVVIVAWELAVIYRNYNYGEKNDDLYINIVRLMFIFIILNPLRHKKYRFSKFKFEDDSVSIICGNVIRTVKRKEKFNISVMSLRYMYRYGGKISKFIVIWKDGYHEPENEASPYVTLRRYITQGDGSIVLTKNEIGDLCGSSQVRVEHTKEPSLCVRVSEIGDLCVILQVSEAHKRTVPLCLYEKFNGYHAYSIIKGEGVDL